MTGPQHESSEVWVSRLAIGESTTELLRTAPIGGPADPGTQGEWRPAGADSMPSSW